MSVQYQRDFAQGLETAKRSATIEYAKCLSNSEK